MPKLETQPKIITSTSWDGKHTLEFNEGSHRYKLDGKRIKGATTVNSGYPKAEALIRWMVKQGIEEYVNKTQMQKGADIGTILHNYAECYEKGLAFDRTLIETSQHKSEIERVIDRFTNWRSNNSDKVLRMEDIIASVELQVGGKIDTLRERDGLGLVLSDYKTSKDIYMEQLLQVIGGYRRMLREWLNLDVPYVEIVTFPKLVEDDMHILLADANGWVKDGARTEVPGLFNRIEAQFARNAETYKFRREIDERLFADRELTKRTNE